MKKEIELKYRLASKLDLELFMHFVKPLTVGPITHLRQENSYFDDKNIHLRKNGISLRLRQENSEYFLCAKQSLKGKRTKHNLSIRLEYEARIDKNIADLIKDHLLSPLEAFRHLSVTTESDEATKKTLWRHMEKASGPGVYLVGSFVNQRTMMPVSLNGQTIVLEFDHSVYPHSMEIFEVEVEFSSEKEVLKHRDALEALFARANIKTYRSSSKSSRLFKILFSGGLLPSREK